MISFHIEEIDFQIQNKEKLIHWIESTIIKENKSLNTISYIFCSDEYLHKINLQYLQHDTLTDIITFPYNDGDNIEGDIFISIDRIKENSQIFKTSFDKELHRVMIHGVLHLIGYGDKSPEEKSLMTQNENKYLSFL
ncbi:MAG TPA: rRNA maturation RNase YbeY [Bacteroidetes bacterium]|nr:rRNA maturation RNase YbeY [Bacteroidota bacterium]